MVISKFICNSRTMDIGILTHESHHCAASGPYLSPTQTLYIHLCVISTYPGLSLAAQGGKIIMSSENAGSGWPPTATNSHVDDEWDNSFGIGPGYEGFTGNSAIAASEYPAYSSYPGDFFSTTTGASITQATSMSSPTYAPNDIEYSNSNTDYQETFMSPGYQNQSL